MKMAEGTRWRHEMKMKVSARNGGVVDWGIGAHDCTQKLLKDPTSLQLL